MKAFLRNLAPAWALRFYHFLWAFFGAVWFWFPSRHLTVIGVTGTNGKSTVVRMIHAIAQAAGIPTAALSTVEEVVGDASRLNPHKGTMPGRGRLQRFLRRAVRSGCRVVIVEVTSEGIVQERHRLIRWAGAVLTNIAPEHIERHGSFEAYRAAKLRLFREGLQGRGFAVINADDPAAPVVVSAASPAAVSCVSVETQPSIFCATSFRAEDIRRTEEGQSFVVGSDRVTLLLPGRFNVVNALCAFAAGVALGVDRGVIVRALASVRGVPGRMETVVAHPFRAVVDYAHTPDALEKVYATLRQSERRNDGGRLLCVLGAAGGGRDRWKRSAMGTIAADQCDVIWLTNEDPYDEDPMAILNEIERGFADAEGNIPPYRKVLDRREAIRRALNEARDGDTVIITGKGSEQEMAMPRGKTILWDDRKVVREEYRSLRGAAGNE